MKNPTIFNQLISNYNEFSFTHNYVFGFEYKGNIYYTFENSEILPFVLCLDSASRGAGYSLRFKPTNEQKILLLQNAKVLCSADFFKNEVTSSIYNAGEIFEKLFTEMNNQKWEKDNVPFTKAGDIEINGIAYQIKFNKATFTSEKQMARLRAN